MPCLKCNKIIPDNSVFCLHCGMKQETQKPVRKTKTRGNGTGTAYKRGKYWEAQYTKGYKINEKTGKIIAIKKRKSCFKTKKEALDYIPILAAEKNIKKEVLCFESFWKNYSENALLKLKSKKSSYKTAYNKIANYKKYDFLNAPITEIIPIVMLNGVINIL